MGVATGNTIHHTHFHVPHYVPHGDYRLVVIANGIASHPVEVRVERRRRRDHDDDEYHDGHDEEMMVFEREETKYKDRDVKGTKEKEKDVKKGSASRMGRARQGAERKVPRSGTPKR